MGFEKKKKKVGFGLKGMMRGCIEPLGGLGAPITECVHKAGGVGDCFYFEPVCGAGKWAGT